jgi:hypothetical protein
MKAIAVAKLSSRQTNKAVTRRGDQPMLSAYSPDKARVWACFTSYDITE